MARNVAVIFLMTAALAAGCGQNPPPRDRPQPSPVAHMPDLSFEHEVPSPAPPPEPDDNSGGPIGDPELVTVVDPEEYIANWKKTLNSMIDSFALEQGRPPKNLNELVEFGMLETVPSAPNGKKFDIEPRYQQVVVVGDSPDGN